MNILIVCAVLLLFSWYDAVLRVGRILDRKGALAYSDVVMDRVLERIFSILRCYRGFSIEVDDRLAGKLPERFVLVANHQSMIDILILIVCLKGRRLRFVAKRELGNGIPLVSQMLRIQGHCLVARKVDPAQSLRALDRYARRCRLNKANPVIFPEGTRARDGQLKHFHSGGLRRVMADGPLPIVVVALDGGWRVATIRSILHNLKGSSYRMRVAAVLPAPATKQEVVAATERCKEIIGGALAEMRA